MLSHYFFIKYTFQLQHRPKKEIKLEINSILILIPTAFSTQKTASYFTKNKNFTQKDFELAIVSEIDEWTVIGQQFFII